MKKLKVGLLHSLIRMDEKLILDEFKKHSDVALHMVDDRQITFHLGKDRDRFDFDVVLERCINHSRALHALVIFESAGIRCVNSAKVATTCGDKLLTSLALKVHGVPQPEVRIAFTEESALQAIEQMARRGPASSCGRAFQLSIQDLRLLKCFRGIPDDIRREDVLDAMETMCHAYD